MKQWYRVKVYRGHQGAGRNSTCDAYVYARDITQVLTRYRGMPGVKRHIGRAFPEITPLSHADSEILEQRIHESKQVSLKHAKQYWFYDLTSISA